MTKDMEFIGSTFPGVQSGFLDVKVPAKGRRKPFGPWKCWRRHWVSARWNSDGEVDLSLSSSPDSRVTQTIRLPVAANLCRTKSRSRLHAFVAVPPGSGSISEEPTNWSKGSPGGSPGGDTLPQNEPVSVYLAGRSEAETQRWMDALRSMLARPTYTRFDEPAFTVTFSDTAFARRAGFAGATALLTTKRGVGIMVHDVSTGALVSTWNCSMISNSQIAGDSMVIVVTTKEFPFGAGQFHVQCAKAAPLARALNAIGRAAPSNLALQRGRRLGRSEGDLFLEFQEHTPPLPSREPRERELRAKHSFSPLRLLASRRRAETMVGSTRSLNVAASPPTTALSALGGKIASGLLSAGLGLILSTPGGSEAEDNDDDSEIGDVEYSDVEVEEDALNATLVSEDGEGEGERRASIASGIYEEIYENAAAAAMMRLDAQRLETQPEDPYEDPALLFSPIDWPGSPKDPPPLPPRHNIPSLDDFKRLSSNESSSSLETGSTESHYMPMSPSRHSAPPICPTTESYYMPMASPKNYKLLEETKPLDEIKSCVAER